jgi:hypothetical protein
MVSMGVWLFAKPAGDGRRATGDGQEPAGFIRTTTIGYDADGTATFTYTGTQPVSDGTQTFDYDPPADCSR